jgi:hypothetical protein
MALFGGVEIAHAGLGDGVVIPPPPAVETPPLTEAVDDAVTDAKQSIEEAVADAPATVEAIAETTKDAVAGTPVESVINDVEKTVEPIVKGTRKTIDPVVGEVVEQAKSVPAVTDGPAATAGGKAGASTVATAAADVPGARDAPPHGRSAAPGSPMSLPPTGGAATELTTSAPATGDLSQPWLPGWIAPTAALQSSDSERDASSNAPSTPLAPVFPAETPATASAGGATGVALVAALLAALLLLAPRTGRLARPGPILVRAEPCLSLSERPG